jgi:glycosyltransferase 2 family protein
VNRERISIVVGLVVTGLCLYLAARNVDVVQLKAVLAEAKWRWIPAMVAISALDLTIRAARWRLLLGQGGLWTLFRLEAIGLAVNNVLFLRLGELTRAVVGARELGLPVATLFASVVVERALDVAALLSIFNLAALAVPGMAAASVRGAALAVLAAALGGLAILTVAEAHLKPGGRLEVLLRPWPKLHDLVEKLAQGAQALRHPGQAAAILALSLALWLCDAVIYWVSAAALNLTAFIDYPRSILILSWAGAGSALPAAPGAVGTFEAMVTKIVTDLGAPAHAAFGYAVFCHMVMYVCVTGLGLVFLYRVGLSLAGLKEALARR